MTPAGPPRRVLRELGDIVDPAHTALVVVDVQNDFCHRNGGLGQAGGGHVGHREGRREAG